MNYARHCSSSALIATFCLAIVSPAPVDAKEVNTDEVAEIANELSDRFATLGNFHAEYSAVSPTGGELQILLDVNRAKNFVILRMIRGGDESQEVFASARLLEDDGDLRSFVFLGGNPQRGASLEIPFAEFLGNVLNAAGLFGFLAAMAEDESSFDEPTNSGKHGIGIGLGLERSDLIFGVEYTSKIDGITGMWLPLKGNASEVTRVEQTDEYVDFFYPESRVVRVDRATGLLIRDSYPAPGRDSPREMKLVERRDTSEVMAMEDLLPAYWQTMTVQKIPEEHAEQVFLQEFLSSLGDALSEIEDLDTWLEEGRHSIGESARRRFRNDGFLHLTESKVEEFIRKSLWPVYELAVEKDPLLTYENFLDSVIDLNEKEDLLNGVMGVTELENRWKNYESHLLHVAPERRRPLAKVYRALLPELVHAYKKELIRHILDEARSVRPEKETQVPD